MIRQHPTRKAHTLADLMAVIQAAVEDAGKPADTIYIEKPGFGTATLMVTLRDQELTDGSIVTDAEIWHLTS